MSKHTPAPWAVNDTAHGPGNGIIHVQSNDPFEQDICTVWGSSLATPEQHVANARLISAAPDLLAALKALMPEGWGDDDTMDHMPGVKLARLAIAKAEGR